MKKIPQATRGPQGAADITVSGNTILITNLEIHDADAADELRDLPDEQRAQTTARAFKVGYAALRQAGVTVNIDYIQREMERLISRVDEANEEAIDVVKAVLKANFADEEGRLPRTLEAYFGDRGSVRGFLDDLFDDGRRDSAIGKISTLLGRYFDGDAAKLAVLLNPAREGSPLSGFRQEIRESLSAIGDRLTAMEAGKAARADERSKGTAKGGDFEGAVVDRLAELAHGLGDTVEGTGRIIGDSIRGLAGDVVISLDPAWTHGMDVRIAVEVKSGAISTSKLASEMERARRNRSATVGLAILAPGCAPGGTAPLALRGNDVICEWDAQADQSAALEAAVRVARVLALLRARGAAGEIDIAVVQERLQVINNNVARVRSIRGRLTSITRCATEVADELDDMRTEILGAVLDIEKELARHDDLTVEVA